MELLLVEIQNEDYPQRMIVDVEHIQKISRSSMTGISVFLLNEEDKVVINCAEIFFLNSDTPK